VLDSYVILEAVARTRGRVEGNPVVGYKVVGVWKETASGTKDERVERKKVLALAQAARSM
jgi:hypothetical protein